MNTQDTHQLAYQLAKTLAFVHESLSNDEDVPTYAEGYSAGKAEALAQVHPDTAILASRAALEQRTDYLAGYRQGNIDGLGDLARAKAQAHDKGHDLATAQYREALRSKADELAQMAKARDEAYAKGRESLEALGSPKEDALAQAHFNKCKEVLDCRVNIPYDPARDVRAVLPFKDITLTLAHGTTVLAFIRKKGYITPKLAISRSASEVEMVAYFDAVLNLPLLSYGADRK